MINKIKFKNYKLFKNEQSLELKPLTILIGKNSSGKSAVLKLQTLIEGSLSGQFKEPLRLNNKGIELGGEFKDLLYGRVHGGQLELTLESDSEKIDIIIGADKIDTPSSSIFSWKLNAVESDLSKENFKGFLTDTQTTSSITLSTHYISSYREGLGRFFENNNNNSGFVGLKGENSYAILIKDALTTPQTLVKKVSEFYQNNFEGWGIRVNQDKAPAYQIELERSSLKINFKDVGLGMIHALPLVIQSFIPSEEKSLIIIEEPELHLHPAAHGNLAERFADSLLDTNKHYLIETHSQNFILRLRRLIAEGRLSKDKLVIYYVDFDEEKSESSLTKILIDDLGKPRNEAREIYWPKNIFSETLDETSAIRTAQLDREHDSRN